MVDTTLGKLLRAVTSDMVLSSKIKDPVRLQNRALLWLHEQEIVRLKQGTHGVSHGHDHTFRTGKTGFRQS